MPVREIKKLSRICSNFAGICKETPSLIRHSEEGETRQRKIDSSAASRLQNDGQVEILPSAQDFAST
jgi:hypothetical protein